MLYQAINKIPFHRSWLSPGLLSLLMISLFLNVLDWIFFQLIQPEHLFSQMALISLITFLLYQIYYSEFRPEFQINYNPWAISLLVLAGGLYVLNEHYLAINIFSATFSIFAFYAFLGLFINFNVWKRGLLFTFIFILLLPFGDYIDVFLGFPLRLASAQMASDLLSQLGFNVENVKTLIELDNQLTSVDLSCSGVHGLWSGMIFFVLLTWIEHKAINIPWFILFLFFLILISVVNVLRIVLMVIMESVFHQFQFAALVHNSLGIIGFAMVCIIGWLLLSLIKTHVNSREIKCAKKMYSENRMWRKNSFVLWLLVLVFFCYNLINTPMIKVSVPISTSSPIFQAKWNEITIPLNAQEKSFFPRQGAYAQKFQFDWHNKVPGSVVLVNTFYWKAHHDPKNCFQSQGYKLLDDKILQISNSTLNQMSEGGLSEKNSKQFLVRKLFLTKANEHFTAYYWFQSHTQQTSDFSQRLFADIFSSITEPEEVRHKKTWTMVSLLIKDMSASKQENEQALLNELSEIIQRWLMTIENNKPLNKIRKISDEK